MMVGMVGSRVPEATGALGFVVVEVGPGRVAPYCRDGSRDGFICRRNRRCCNTTVLLLLSSCQCFTLHEDPPPKKRVVVTVGEGSVDLVVM